MARRKKNWPGRRLRSISAEVFAVFSWAVLSMAPWRRLRFAARVISARISGPSAKDDDHVPSPPERLSKPRRGRWTLLRTEFLPEEEFLELGVLDLAGAVAVDAVVEFVDLVVVEVEAQVGDAVVELLE